jgi:hypothetical protein
VAVEAQRNSIALIGVVAAAVVSTLLQRCCRCGRCLLWSVFAAAVATAAATAAAAAHSCMYMTLDRTVASTVVDFSCVHSKRPCTTMYGTLFSTLYCVVHRDREPHSHCSTL